jgi:hypothetical protein
MLPLFLLFLFSGALCIVLAIPLMRRRIPPNRLYGLRVRTTLSDPAVWYEANARSGRDLLALGVMLILLALALPWLAVDVEHYALLWSAAALIGTLALAWIGWRRANRLHARTRGHREAPPGRLDKDEEIDPPIS